MSKIVVLGGAGAMGQVIVRDLVKTSKCDEIVIAEFNLQAAEALRKEINSPKLHAQFADLTKTAELSKLLQGATVLINSTPYVFNVSVMEAALAAGCHYLDLGGLFHVTKKQLELHERYVKANLLAVLGMGAAPGMTNIMAAEGAQELDKIDDIDIVVGCIDFVELDHPLVLPYAIDTILDEYTKEPMVFENGDYKPKPPMSGEIELDFPEPVGKCKAILTLHSEVLTIPKSFADKGLRGTTFRLGLPSAMHDKLKFLVELGFGGSKEVQTDKSSFVPRKVLAKMLSQFPIPQCVPDDCEAVRVDVIGSKGGAKKTIRVESIIRADTEWKVSCGAYDTGVPPSIVAQMIADGTITDRGVLAPEVCVPRKEFFDALAKRRITIEKRVLELAKC